MLLQQYNTNEIKNEIKTWYSFTLRKSLKWLFHCLKQIKHTQAEGWKQRLSEAIKQIYRLNCLFSCCGRRWFQQYCCWTLSVRLHNQRPQYNVYFTVQGKKKKEQKGERLSTRVSCATVNTVCTQWSNPASLWPVPWDVFTAHQHPPICAIATAVKIMTVKLTHHAPLWSNFGQ